ncbi:diacylglycerol/lipid kinase family protein [Aureibacillus halotolerans]|uniref:YegS/Rv2252/BmrU family lipid kinase n=1 Tax=Aureibacillus halotolerans TaxID=1508390 RepID=A0A4R6TSX2_9BACI|nr:diacylglycerol kinase family protein [Aureibacillus halotolerans]TDQ36421.1 YegS/Rv2252/BmrU family lipid kinase [Aureibacillus halotolerans]
MSQILSVALVVNPNAGKQKIIEELDHIEETLLKHFQKVETFQTKGPEEVDDLIDSIHQTYDLIIGAGGDGTIYQLANALSRLNHRPVFAVLPGGTANDFSRALGMSQDPLEALDQIIQCHIEPIDIGYDGDQYFLNFWGIGLITTVSQQVNNKDSLGRLSYYLSTLQNMKEAKPFHVKIESDEFHFDGEAVMVLVGNSPFTGGVRAFFPSNNLQDGTFDVLIIKQSTMPSFIEMFRSRLQQAPPEHEDLVYGQAKKIRVVTEPNLEIDCDGERRFTTPSTIVNLPQHLQLVVGDFKSQT